jgi:hypothetical protein
MVEWGMTGVERIGSPSGVRKLPRRSAAPTHEPVGPQRAPRRRRGTGLPAGTSWEEPRDHSPPCTPVRVMQITFDKKSRAQRRVRFLASDGIAQDSFVNGPWNSGNQRATCWR